MAVAAMATGNSDEVKFCMAKRGAKVFPVLTVVSIGFPSNLIRWVSLSFSHSFSEFSRSFLMGQVLLVFWS